MTAIVADPDSYRTALAEYLRSHSEAALYQASQMSRAFVERGIGPDEIVAMHFEAIELVTQNTSFREKARATTDGLQFLLEVMIAYGVHYQAYLQLRMDELARQAAAREGLERERAEQAERAEREKMEILANIAHELGTPLTAVKGYMDMAGRLVRAGRFEAVPEALGTAREALDRLSHLTADLARVSHGEALQIDLAPLALGPVVERACTWAKAAAAEKGVAVYCAAMPPRVCVLGNADALLTVFGNLLSNAIRYTESGGNVHVRAWQDRSAAYVEVRDTGIGMPPEVQARIFEKFYRAGDARQVSPSGLGLGLALAQGIVQAHDGAISVVSAPGHGSTFTVTLKAVEAQEECAGGSAQHV